jgi:hypothetical protein
MRWAIGGRGLATAATANHVLAQLWNPSSTRSVFVTGISLAQTAAVVSNSSVRRSSARGATPTSTVTPTIANDYERKIIPPTVAVLELATFGTQPTLDGPELFKWNEPAAIGSGFMIPFETKDVQGIQVLPGAGLTISTPVAVIHQVADVTFFCME